MVRHGVLLASSHYGRQILRLPARPEHHLGIAAELPPKHLGQSHSEQQPSGYRRRFLPDEQPDQASIPRHPWRSPEISPTTFTFTAHQPHLRNGPLMATASPLPAGSPGPPPPLMRFVSLGSRLRLQLPSHPASRRTQLLLACG